jgi:hypothetical protein
LRSQDPADIHDAQLQKQKDVFLLIINQQTNAVNLPGN